MDPEQLFNENFAAISEAKKKAGNWEAAYKMVTGQKWPGHSHIVVDENGGHMAKDNKLGKVAKIASIAGPIAATILTGGAASPWLVAAIGAATGAANGAANGGGWKGALKGAAVGGATSYGGAKIGQLLKGAQAAKGVAGAAGGASEASKFGPLAGGYSFQGAPASLVSNEALDAGIQGALGSAAEEGGKSLLSKAGSNVNKLMSSKGKDQAGQKLSDLGSVLGGSRSNEMSERMVEGEFMQGADKLNLAYSEENRNRQNDAMQNLARTSYLLGGGAQPLPTRVNSGTLPNLGFGPKPASDAQKEGAATLQSQLLSRLYPEGQLKQTNPTTYAKPGKLENASKWGSLIANGISVAKSMRD